MYMSVILNADRRVFQLSDQAWQELMAILDRPANSIPELTRLLQEPAPWDN